ncbi:hypothetical protein WJX82_009543 [Trebouxia sp. C0006]
MEEVVRMSVDKDKRGVLEVSLWTRDGTRQVEKVDLGVFYRSCLTSWGKGSQHRPDCIRGCPRPYLYPQGMLDDMGPQQVPTQQHAQLAVSIPVCDKLGADGIMLRNDS